MAEDHRAGEFAHHGRSNLAGERALLLEVHILRTQFQAAEQVTIQHIAHRRQRDRGRTEDSLNVGVTVHLQPQFRYEIIGELRGPVWTVVHLPIACDDCIAHWYSHQFLSCKAATPGRTRPSRNSSEAPPPVETWVILSAAPACSTVAAESPPPMIVVAPALVRSANISIIALVPLAKAGHSATPSVPLKTIVCASARARW